MTNTLQDFTKTMKVKNDDGTITNLKLNLWDAAGDNNIHNIAHLFLRDVQLAILVYSIESKLSFDEMDEWHSHLHQYNPDCLIALVGNKSDLKANRKVSIEHALEKRK